MKGVLRAVFENNVGFHCLLKTRCGSRGGGASLYKKNQRSCRTNGSPIIALGFPGGSAVKSLPAMQEMQEIQVQSLGVEDSLEEEMATQSSILAWRITGQRSVMDYNPWGLNAWNVTEHTRRQSQP